MAFKITIEELSECGEPLPSGSSMTVYNNRQIYSQTVDTINLKSVIDAINYKPRVRKEKNREEKTGKSVS